MRRDPRVFVLGEDVGMYGGAFKVTEGMQEEFGAWRVIDMPLSETAIVGGATGAALMGLRPVAEMQFADFVSCAWDHLVTVAAKQHYRAGTPIPIVLRLPSGGGFSGGPFHSQNPEIVFAHIPGLKIVCPSTPEDAKGLLVSAIEDSNPVLFFEHKHLYRRIKGHVPDERYTIPSVKRAAIERATTSSSSRGAQWCTQPRRRRRPSAETTSRSRSSTFAPSFPGIGRCPRERAALLEGARPHEDTRTGGFGAEIAATSRRRHSSIWTGPSSDSPRRTAGAVLALLEKAFIPQVEDVIAALDELVAY